MSLKAELETWSAALQAYDTEDFDKSLDLFARIADNSKILTNMGLIFATIGEHEQAVDKFMEATDLDQYLAVAYFQCGVSNFLLTRYELAQKDFEEAWVHLRGNQDIRYQQLGLKFILYSAEILFNKGLSQIYQGRSEEGMADLRAAQIAKATEEHDVIDEAIENRGEGYTVFSIPVGVLYRPADVKIKNTKLKDYLGKAKLVAASDGIDAYTTFSGATRLKQGITPSGVFIDSPPDTSDPPLARSNSVATPRLGRSQTFSEPRQGGPPVLTPSSDRPVLRANTTITRAAPSSNARLGDMGRSSPRMSPTQQPTPQTATPDRSGRVTEFYDQYLNSYNEDIPPPPPLPDTLSPGSKNDRIAAWAQKSLKETTYPPVAFVKEQSRSAPSTVYASSSYGSSASLRRRTTRRPRASRLAYDDEEEEGYASGEYDDGMFELHKIRVKLHYEDDLRGMTLSPDMSFKDFVRVVIKKFGSKNGLGLKFKDEDGGMVSLKDESDYELAIETARESAKGKPEGKLEIWCTEL